MHINCVYAHPIEFILGNVIPLFAGLLVFSNHIHLISLQVWVNYRLLETHEAHGGYEFDISVFKANPLGIDSNFHNFHHLKNIGNYGTFFYLWDRFFGTDKAYRASFKTK